VESSNNFNKADAEQRVQVKYRPWDPFLSSTALSSSPETVLKATNKVSAAKVTESITAEGEFQTLDIQPEIFMDMTKFGKHLRSVVGLMKK